MMFIREFSLITLTHNLSPRLGIGRYISNPRHRRHVVAWSRRRTASLVLSVALILFLAAAAQKPVYAVPGRSLSAAPSFSAANFPRQQNFVSPLQVQNPGTYNLSYVGDLTFDSSGNLWVVDAGDSRVLEFTHPFSNGMSASLVLGQADFTSNDGGGAQSTLVTPGGLAFDSSGNLWVTDSASEGVFEFVPPFSNGMGASIGIGGHSLDQYGFNGPGATVFDSSGNLWVADFQNSRVLKFVPPFSNGMGADLVIGQPDFMSYDAGTPQNGVGEPGGLAFDSSGNLSVSDSFNNRVLEFSPPFSSGMNASMIASSYEVTQATSFPTSTLLIVGIMLGLAVIGILGFFMLRKRRIVAQTPKG